MPEIFNKERFLNNVFYLAKSNGISISALENKIEISTGYLTKLRNDDSRKNISADVMFAIADVLNVSVDVLCKAEFEKLNYDESILIKFFEKFKVDTLNNKCKWEQETSMAIMMGHGHIGKSELIKCGTKYVYNSLIREGEDVLVVGNSYVLQISPSVYLALVRVRVTNNPIVDELEAYILDERNGRDVKKLCATGKDNIAELDTVVEDLYKVAENSGKRLALDYETSIFITNYMREPEELHYDGLPF